MYKTLRFNFKSSDKTLPDSKKLNTDIWYEENSYLWVKAAFEKSGYLLTCIFRFSYTQVCVIFVKKLYKHGIKAWA